MKYITFIFVVLFSMNAYALCGATIELEGDRGNEYDRWGSQRGTTFGFSINIPLFDTSCDKDLADIRKKEAEARDKDADAMDQKIRNLNRIIDICKKQDIPSLCARIPEMAAEINLD